MYSPIYTKFSDQKKFFRNVSQKQKLKKINYIPRKYIAEIQNFTLELSLSFFLLNLISKKF